MAVKMIEEKSGASFTHVPYKGVAASMADFLGGRLAFIIAVPDVVKAQIESGKARALATSVKLPLFPDVPAWTDLGLPEVPQSFSVMAPATTPDAIVEAMNRALMKVMQEPGVKRRIQDMGYVPVFDTPAEFAKDLKEERVMWKGVIERNHITVE
jgi:tripartite-type tricarboxylate transporter receptor subunit TctC